MSAVQTLINEFVGKMEAAIEQTTREKVLAAFDGLGAGIKNGIKAGLAAKKNGKLLAFVPVKRRRRKGPIQLCPVPKCTGRAAPVYGMVCAEHKKVPKKLIAQYREARRKAAEKAKN